MHRAKAHCRTFFLTLLIVTAAALSAAEPTPLNWQQTQWNGFTNDSRAAEWAEVLTFDNLSTVFSGRSFPLRLWLPGFYLVLVIVGLSLWRALSAERSRSRATLLVGRLRRQLHSQRVKNTEQQQFVSILAHELKTPLSVLRLASAEPSQRMREFSKQAIADMAGMIDRCAKAVELEGKQPILQMEPCDLPAELDTILRRSADPQRLVITAADFPDFQTDIGLFSDIVSNLVENALKYSDPTCHITLDFTHEERDGQRGLALVIANASGPVGLPDPLKVFDKFYRSPSAHRFAGMGLGLFLVRSISHLLGGSVSCACTEERVTFHLWLRY